MIRTALAEATAENARLVEEIGRLRQNEAHFRELFNATYDGILLLDVEQGRVLEANAPACRLVGYSPGRCARSRSATCTRTSCRASSTSPAR